MTDPWVRTETDPWARRTTRVAPAPVASRPPAGWYPDPNGQVRYWDGRAWGPLPPHRSAPTALIVLGYVCALLIPIVGVICAIVLLFKRQVGHGVAQLVLAFVVVALYVATVGSGY